MIASLLLSNLPDGRRSMSSEIMAELSRRTDDQSRHGIMTDTSAKTSIHCVNRVSIFHPDTDKGNQWH